MARPVTGALLEQPASVVASSNAASPVVRHESIRGAQNARRTPHLRIDTPRPLVVVYAAFETLPTFAAEIHPRRVTIGAVAQLASTIALMWRP
jgi:hypothetical protein